MLKEIYELLDMFQDEKLCGFSFDRDEFDRCIFQFFQLGSLFEPFVVVKQDPFMCEHKPGYLLVHDTSKEYARYLTVAQTYQMIHFLKGE